MFLARLSDELHLSVVISLKRMNRHAVIAKPKELGALLDGSSGKLEKLAVTEIAEFFRAVRIVTLGNHRRSSDTNCAAPKMDARKTFGRCPEGFRCTCTLRHARAAGQTVENQAD